MLLDGGHAVRALARNPDKLADAPWRDRAEVARGDLGDADSLTAAFDGVDVVYYLVHSMGTSADFVSARRGRRATSSRRRGGPACKRLVYLSGLHPDGRPVTAPAITHRRRRDPHRLAASRPLVLQAGIVIGSGSASFEMIRHLTDRLPVMTTPKWVHNKIQPIAIDDVLHYLAEAADRDGAGVADVGRRRARRDGVRRGDAGLRRRGRAARRLIVVLPLLTPSIASWWVGLVTPIPSGLARPLVESLRVRCRDGANTTSTRSSRNRRAV